MFRQVLRSEAANYQKKFHSLANTYLLLEFLYEEDCGKQKHSCRYCGSHSLGKKNAETWMKH